ncbi:hypothetical protein PENSPDRAFT_339207 [Peniophora sp. CONT]|nr:hypothetical protein PENSPDRAFT_339207 [Peniophora sp. CONT]
MSRDAEASTAGAPGISRMTQTNSRSARDLKGVVGSGVEILGVVAAVTQAVPYLGIISGSLTEIIKIYNEVDKFKSEWRSVLDDVSRLKTIVDTVRDELNRSRDEDKRLPPGLVEPLEELEKCISETRRTMDNCKPDVAEGLQRKHLGRLKARGLRVARVVLNRKDLLDSVNRCRANMSTMLHVFNARLNVSHAFALDHQLQRFDNIIVASVDSEENRAMASLPPLLTQSTPLALPKPSSAMELANHQRQLSACRCL